jgi:hypothetical protein
LVHHYLLFVQDRNDRELPMHEISSGIPESVGRLLHFSIPKHGLTADQNEDAAAVRFDSATNVLRIAIADGATESMYSGRWARLLAQRFVNRPPAHGITDKRWLHPLRTAFSRGIDYTALPWYSMTKLENGSNATLLGMRLDLTSRFCRIWSVGDCAVVVMYQSGASKVFPMSMTKRDAFSSTPQLMNTREDRIAPQQKHQHVPLGQGPVDLLFMTDAIGKYVISSKSDETLRELIAIRDADQFEQFVAPRWKEGLIKNDDCTLLHLSLK